MRATTQKCPLLDFRARLEGKGERPALGFELRIRTSAVLGTRKLYEVYAVTRWISRELGGDRILEARDASGRIQAARLNGGHLLLARSNVAAANLRN